jgi:3-hydroxyacyl-[acyl-carrier-protein] dehydratase
VADIKQVLPHRYPMLLVDAVIDLVPGELVRATKTISAEAPCYRGLTDDTPPAGYAYPPVLVLESWCQCGALLAAGERRAGDLALFGGVSGASFHRDVYPGDVLEHRVRVVRRFADTWLVAGESRVGAATVLQVAEAMLAFRPATGR